MGPVPGRATGRRPARAPAGVVAAATALVLGCAACTSPDGTATPTTGSPTGSSTGTLTPVPGPTALPTESGPATSGPPEGGTVETSGPFEVRVVGAPGVSVFVTTDADGSAVATLGAAAVPTGDLAEQDLAGQDQAELDQAAQGATDASAGMRVVAWFAPWGASAEAVPTLLADGSAVLHDADGFVAGFSPPDGGGTLVVDAGVLAVAAPASWRTSGTSSAGTSTGTTPDGTGVVVAFSGVAVVSAVWGEREGGRSLAVTPSTWARGRSSAAHEGLSAQLVALEPEAATETMQDQLACHELGAPDKATWNLEPWRPVVDAAALVVARCNPT